MQDPFCHFQCLCRDISQTPKWHRLWVLSTASGCPGSTEPGFSRQICKTSHASRAETSTLRGIAAGPGPAKVRHPFRIKPAVPAIRIYVAGGGAVPPTSRPRHLSAERERYAPDAARDAALARRAPPRGPTTPPHRFCGRKKPPLRRPIPPPLPPHPPTPPPP